MKITKTREHFSIDYSTLSDRKIVRVVGLPRAKQCNNNKCYQHNDSQFTYIHSSVWIKWIRWEFVSSGPMSLKEWKISCSHTFNIQHSAFSLFWHFWLSRMGILWTLARWLIKSTQMHLIFIRYLEFGIRMALNRHS